MNPLTNREKDICTYTGIFGILLSATCLIQNFIYFRPHFITALLIFVYILSIAAFSLLAAQHVVAPLLLIITGSILFLCEGLLILAGVFSLVVILLFIYVTVIAAVLYIDGFPGKLRQKALASRAEKDLWKGKI